MYWSFTLSAENPPPTLLHRSPPLFHFHFELYQFHRMIWFHQKQKSQKDQNSNEPLEWIPFSAEDSLNLEREFQASQSECYNGTYTVVVGSDLLFQVNILHQTLLPIYWSEEQLSTRRACWFEKSNFKDSWHPSRFSEQLEGVFETLSARYIGVPIMTTNANNKNLHHHQNYNSISLSPKGSTSTEPFPLSEGVFVTFPFTDLCTGTLSTTPKPTKVTRKTIEEFAKESPKSNSPIYNHQSASNSEEAKFSSLRRSPPKHLILVIHGIGQKFFDKMNKFNFIDDVEAFRLGLKESAVKKGQEIDFQILPIQWRVNLNLLGNEHKNSQLFDEMFARISLPTIAVVRSLMSDLALDVLLYMHPSHYERIIDYLIGELNRVHSLFVKHNPAFSGKISLIGHSLGSVLAFDLLSCPFDGDGKAGPSSRLDFKVDKFWALGSPLGMFLLLKGINLGGTRKALSGHPAVEILKKNVFLDCNEFYNIFHPNDPCAFRIEPLLWPELNAQAPFGVGKISEVCENLRNSSSSSSSSSFSQATTTTIPQQTSNWKLSRSFASMFWTKNSSELQKNDDLVTAAAANAKMSVMKQSILLAPFNAIKRIDFVLSEKMFEYSYLSMLSAHTQYWKDKESSKFVLETMF